MSDILNTIDSLPDISFIDNMTLEGLQSLLLNSFIEKYKEVTGKTIQLSKADPNRIIMLSCAQLIYQGMQNIDKAGKMNFLKYAFDGYMDNLSVFKKVTRNPAKAATVPLRFTLSEARAAATSIPAGTRVTAAYEVYFATTEYAEIPAGETQIEILAECTEAGTVGNDYAAGELSTLVDPIGFISSVTNTAESTGGTEIEDDQSMAERTYLAPSSYSTAGPDDAYEYWVKDSNPSIGDVKISNPTPGVVDIRFVMDDGTVPDDTTVAATQAYVQQRGKRPLTDNVQVKKPTVETYEISIKYFINSSESSSAMAIQAQVETAVSDFILWQATKVGRDINPDELVARIKNAGAKRVVVTAPVFRVIGDTAKAQLSGTPTVTYGGLEND